MYASADGVLAPVKKGSDQRYKQVYVTCLYDQSHAHRLVGVTAGKVDSLKRLLKRDAARVRLRAADERLGIGVDVGSGPKKRARPPRIPRRPGLTLPARGIQSSNLIAG
jgi:hypothetical protein